MKNICKTFEIHAWMNVTYVDKNGDYNNVLPFEKYAGGIPRKQ